MNIGDIFDVPVDDDWYNTKYAKIKSSDISARDHYELYGRKAGLYPTAFVDAIMAVSRVVDRDWYRSEYGDVKASGQDPYFHYAVFGRYEERFPNARAKAAKLNYFLRLESDAAEFDEEFYVNKYPDVASAKIKPFDHFIRFGRDEGRAPNARVLHKRISAEHRPFINMLYQTFIGRDATNDELVEWTLRLISGLSHYNLMKIISESREARVHQVRGRRWA